MIVLWYRVLAMIDHPATQMGLVKIQGGILLVLAHVGSSPA